jgi:mxaJ protein
VTIGLVTMISLLVLIVFAAAIGGVLAAVAIDAARVKTASKLEATLRVCEDPNNLPFSNVRGQGFENAIATLIAEDLGRSLQYYWQPQRRGFLRSTLLAHECDVVMGVPASLERVAVTRPYYRSSYVFVSRRDRLIDIRSFDDPALRTLRIGLQVTGNDYANPPAAEALATRHLVIGIRGYPVYGDYSSAEPQRAIVDAVANGDVDVVVVWGPVAGYFAQRESVPLTVAPVVPSHVDEGMVFSFDIAMAVRREDTRLRDDLDTTLARRANDIRQILTRYGVPLVRPDR